MTGYELVKVKASKFVSREEQYCCNFQTHSRQLNPGKIDPIWHIACVVEAKGSIKHKRSELNWLALLEAYMISSFVLS